MHGGFATIPRIIDVPFIARHARTIAGSRRAQRCSGCRPTGRWRSSSFGGYGVTDFDLQRLDCLDDCGVVVTGPAAQLGVRSMGPFGGLPKSDMYRAGVRYEDLVAAVDVVVTKPGYGIIAECLANNTAMLYTSRGRFAEYDVWSRRCRASCAASTSTSIRCSPAAGATR